MVMLEKRVQNWSLLYYEKALITGITGQDGSYLAEFLLEKDMRYMVLQDELQSPIHHVLTIC